MFNLFVVVSMQVELKSFSGAGRSKIFATTNKA
jgi:hypothetical protein